PSPQPSSRFPARRSSDLQAAIEAREQQADRIEDLEDKKASIEDELATAREHVGSREAQREEYEDWQERKRAEERRRRTAARADQDRQSTRLNSSHVSSSY